MRSLINRFVERHLIPIMRYIKNYAFNGFANDSYAQEGEDIVLMRIFNSKKSGFYVDVGAHHPMRFSNTFSFYKAGWSGINIEPNPDAFHLFNKHRPRDTNLNYGIGEKKSKLEYFMFDESALNTFDRKVLESRTLNTPYQHIETTYIDVVPLADVLKRCLPKGIEIDFLSVDVEGLDLTVLRSNDWDVYRPAWVLAEQLNLSDLENLDFPLHAYMNSIGYALFAKTYNTLFYKDASNI